MCQSGSQKSQSVFTKGAYNLCRTTHSDSLVWPVLTSRLWHCKTHHTIPCQRLVLLYYIGYLEHRSRAYICLLAVSDPIFRLEEACSPLPTFTASLASLTNFFSVSCTANEANAALTGDHFLVAQSRELHGVNGVSKIDWCMDGVE